MSAYKTRAEHDFLVSIHHSQTGEKTTSSQNSWHNDTPLQKVGIVDENLYFMSLAY